MTLTSFVLASSPPTTPAGTLPARATPLDRIWAGLGALAALALLITASRLTPSPSGTGTHTQLGLTPCGFLGATGIPCPTCGMTTAFAGAANLEPRASLRAQPMGTLLALATAAGFWTLLHVALTGSRVLVLVGRLLRPRVLWVVAAAWAASWAYRIAATSA